MDTVVQISIVAVIASLACVLLKKYTAELSTVLSLVCVVVVILMAVRFLKPLLEVFRRLQNMASLLDEIANPLLKVAGISLLTQITSAVCEDAGEMALSKAVSISGSVLAMYAGIPLLLAVIDLLEEALF